MQKDLEKCAEEGKAKTREAGLLQNKLIDCETQLNSLKSERSGKSRQIEQL
jgi:hypothetical protein